MVNTMMDISEAETGAMKLSMESVNVSELVDQAIELYSDVAEDKQIAISTTVPKELCVTADRNRLLHVLANLMDNAIKYTPSGGKVDLAAVPSPDEVVITVADTGVGIADDERTKIYDRLYRGDKSRSERGLGLGLSLVKAIAEAHQGYIEVSSEVGHGSQFALHLRAGPLS
jgi:signal transduction histidine kinase